MKRFPLSLSEENHSILKQVSALSGMSMNDIINDALAAKLYVLSKRYGVRYVPRVGLDDNKLKDLNKE